MHQSLPLNWAAWGAQVKDKATRKAEEAARQRSLDAGMEADRLAALCQYEVWPVRMIPTIERMSANFCRKDNLQCTVRCQWEAGSDLCE